MRAIGVGSPVARPNGPFGPPDGTYVYDVSRNGIVVGKTTVVVRRRDAMGTIEVSESGEVGSAYARATASYRYADSGADSFVATYRAPFLRSWQKGLVENPRPHDDFYDSTTVRYRTNGDRIAFEIDGVSGGGEIAPDSVTPPAAPWVFDAPFMAGVIMLPPFVLRGKARAVAAFSAAFSPDAVARKTTVGRATPHFSQTLKTDRVLVVAGLANIWFSGYSEIVHEAHFPALNLDARLVSHVREYVPAPFAPPPAPQPGPTPEGTEIAIDDDGRVLAGVMNRPPGTAPVPAVVLIPPGPRASRNFDPEGPESAFATIAATLAGRGYAVVRYDTRGVGKSGGDQASQTWEASLADAEAAIRFAQSADGIDAKRVFVLGYGSGADFALASASSPNVSETVAGVIALGPTVFPYAECLRRDRLASFLRAYRSRGQAPPDPSALGAAADANMSLQAGSRAGRSTVLQSYLSRDPVALAEENRVPTLVLHPGAPRCGETAQERSSFDDRLRQANPRTTVVVANDLSSRFGDALGADSLTNTEALFPYRFDASTARAIADWLDTPKTKSARESAAPDTRAVPRSTPPPPPLLGTPRPDSSDPAPRATAEPTRPPP